MTATNARACKAESFADAAVFQALIHSYADSTHEKIARSLNDFAERVCRTNIKKMEPRQVR